MKIFRNNEKQLKMRRTVALMMLVLLSKPAVSQIAVPGESLKKEYQLEGTYDKFYQTGETIDSYSMLCDMGQALPDPKRENWYKNKPIPGLKLELQARAAFKSYDGNYKPMGFVVITKDDEILTAFKPLGDYIDGQWEGDVFNTWSGVNSDIEVFSERSGRKGYAYFDLMSGNGFYYKSNKSEEPDYFLSNCRKIKKEMLPVYDWKFDFEE